MVKATVVPLASPTTYVAVEASIDSTAVVSSSVLVVTTVVVCIAAAAVGVIVVGLMLLGLGAAITSAVAVSRLHLPGPSEASTASQSSLHSDFTRAMIACLRDFGLHNVLDANIIDIVFCTVLASVTVAVIYQRFYFFLLQFDHTRAA
jgi:hypothetical protein